MSLECDARQTFERNNTQRNVKYFNEIQTSLRGPPWITIVGVPPQMAAGLRRGETIM